MEVEVSHHQNKNNNRIIISYFCFIITYFGLILTNKGIANTLGNEDWLLISCIIWQDIVCILLLLLCSLFGLSSPIKPFNFKKLKKIIFAPILFSLMVFSSLESLKYVSIPTMNAFRNFALFFTVIGEWILFDTSISIEIIFIIILMFFSAITAGWSEISLTLLGTFWVILNGITASGYLLYLRIIMKKTKITNITLAYYNNLLSVPLLIPFGIIMKFIQPSLGLFYRAYSFNFCILILINGICAFGMTISSFWALRSSSATTFSVTRSLSKIPLSIIGIIIFPTTFNSIGKTSIALALLAAVLFTYIKSSSKKQNDSFLNITKIDKVENI